MTFFKNRLLILREFQLRMFLPRAITPVSNSFQGLFFIKFIKLFQQPQYIWQRPLSIPLENCYLLNLCAVTSLMPPICYNKGNCDDFLSSSWRKNIISPIHPHCDVVLWYFQPYGGRNLILISCKLDWRDHCPPFTMTADQQIREQGWIIVPNSLSYLK